MLYLKYRADETLGDASPRVMLSEQSALDFERALLEADDAARTVVFVEVKTRTSDQFGGVSQAVTPMKVRRLRRLAGLWLAAQHGQWAAVRIDVIGVRIGRSRTPEITHMQGVG